MIRIAFLVSTLEGYGLVKSLYNLTKYINKDPQFEVHMITLSKEPENTMINEFTKEGIPVHCIGMSRLNGLFFAQKKLTDIVKKEQINIIHSNGFRANLIHQQIQKHIPNVKEVMTIHLDPEDDAKHPLGPLFSLWRKYKHIAIIKQCPWAVACSQSVSEALIKYKITIPYIQNGIDLNTYTLTESEKKALKARYSIPEGIPISIVLSGLHKRKNIAIIIETYNQLGEKYPLLVVGDGPDKEELQQLATNKSIHFAGFQKEIAQYLSLSDIYLSASYSEGLPLSVMEAMDNMAIPILSAIPPHCEIVENSSFERYLFDCDDQSMLLSHCRSLLEMKNLQELKLEAKKLIERKFTAQRMANDYCNLYLKCINE